MIFQDVDCVVDNKKKTDLTKPRELPQVPPVKNDISMENSSSPVKIVLSHLFLFNLDHVSC
jgi:hypothetical protein